MVIFDLLKNPIRFLPITTEIFPEKRNAPDANAIPKHKGRATKYQTRCKIRFEVCQKINFFCH